MGVVAVDSFSVSANTDWPTDSRIMKGFLNRASRCGRKLVKLGLPGFTDAYIPEWLKQLKQIDFRLACLGGKPHSRGKLKTEYRRFLKIVDKILLRLIRQYNTCIPQWNSLSLPPSRQRIRDAVTNSICRDIEGVLHVYQYASDRIFRDISLPAPEKILSLSDECAAFIQKGRRDPVIGYKPQISRTGNGFISAYDILEGNPQDSTRLCSIIESHVANTGTIPETVTTDDGYRCKKVRNHLLQRMKISTVSMNGAKGKKITPIEQWNSEQYASARNIRSAVESMIFTLRFKFHLYRFSRRGLQAVTAELLEKIITHNLWRIAFLKKQRLKQLAA